MSLFWGSASLESFVKMHPDSAVCLTTDTPWEAQQKARHTLWACQDRLKISGCEQIGLLGSLGVGRGRYRRGCVGPFRARLEESRDPKLEMRPSISMITFDH